MKLSLTTLSVCFAAACLGMFAFSGCAANANHLKTSPKDPSRPNIASIYYYISASYLYYGGDFNSAGQLYNRALEQDSASPHIKKQILINAAYAYVNGQMSKEEVETLFAEAREKQSFDSDLLNAAYTVYNQANDRQGQQWCISETISRYPSARAYLQKFYFSFSLDGSLDKDALDQAIKLAAGNHDDLVLAARMSTLSDPQQSLNLLRKALQVENRMETRNLLAEMTLQYGSPESISTLFQAYLYPDDKALMLSFLQMANKNRRFEQIIGLKASILQTADPSLLGELAFAAYLQDDSLTLNQVYQSVQTRPSEPEADSKLAVFLLAASLFSKDFADPQKLTGLLYSIQDVDDLVLYVTLRQALNRLTGPQPESKEALVDLASAAKLKLQDTLLIEYLSVAANSTQKDDPAFLAARNALCEEFVLAGKGYETDWSAVLTAYHAEKRFGEKLHLLRQAIARFPDNPLFLNDLGYSLLEYPDSLSEAGLLITRAISLESDNPYYQDSMAWYFFLTGDLKAALIHLELPKQMENPPAEIAYHIGMILRANDELEAAKEYFLKALNDSSSPEYVQKAKQALE